MRTTRPARIICHVLGWFFLTLGLAGWAYFLANGTITDALQTPTEFGPDKATRQMAAIPIAVFSVPALIGAALLVPAFGGFQSRPLRALLVACGVVAVGMLAIFVTLINR